MTAVDTNVLVRLLTSDDPRQSAAAKALFTASSIWIAKTVLLETAWVLRTLYGFEQPAIAVAFTQLLGLKNVRVEDALSVANALHLTTHGFDFADAIHLASTPPGSTFVSFDKALLRRAKRAGALHASTLPA